MLRGATATAPWPVRPSRLMCMLIVAAGTLLGTAASGQESRPRSDTPRTDAQWIQAVRLAAVRINYSGTVVYQSGGEMRSSRITHLFDGVHSLERIQTLDGKPREFLRRRSASTGNNW